MNTLAEIEAALEQLPPPQQETLLARLARKLAERVPTGAPERTRREHWLRKLDGLEAPVEPPFLFRTSLTSFAPNEADELPGFLGAGKTLSARA